MSAPPTVLIDGITSISTHNGVHRVVGFRLDPKGKPLEAVEIHVPGPALKALLEALRKVEK